MYALARSHVVRRSALSESTPLPLLLAIVVAVAGVWALAVAGVVSPRLARAVGAGAAHGALLATAVAWTVARLDPARDLLPVGVAVAALAGALGAALAPLGAVAYLLTPLWLWRRRARLRGLGIDRLDVRFLAAGAALGAVLGVHLMITASLTLGYRASWPDPLALAPWVAYDIGANVLAAECFFRGALFDRAQRRWPFAAAAALSTVTCLARYLIDPLLPRTLEVAAGAAFYIALLSLGNCWLYWRSGSVLPGLAAGVVFFAVYRLLHVVR